MEAAACVTIANRRGVSVEEVGPCDIQITAAGIWVPPYEGRLRSFYPWHRVNWIADYEADDE